MFVLDSSFVQRRCQQALELRSERKNMKYLNIERELCESPDWPPVSQTSQSLAQLMSLESTPHQAQEYTIDDGTGGKVPLIDAEFIDPGFCVRDQHLGTDTYVSAAQSEAWPEETQL